MNIELRQINHEHHLITSGSWETHDEISLKKALSSVPPDIQKLAIEMTELDDIPLACVQVLLAYIRYARSIPKPVHVYFNKNHEAKVQLWGLDRFGWEHFFHGR